MSKLSQDVIDTILQSGRIYEVGGAVRDRMLKSTTVKDRDYLVTGIPYDRLTELLKGFGRVDLVGKSFGVIKFTQRISGGMCTFDISLPRKEHSTGVGHKDFDVAFDPNLPVEEDLVRRDFTINAMALALDNDELIDPLGGMADLEAGLLRMTSSDSFIDDPLRMLRAVQFAARFDFTIEDATLAAIREHAGLIATVSAERISDELNKLLERAEKPSVGFRLMQTTGLLKEVMPELDNCVGVDQPGGYHKHDVFEHTMHAIDAAKPDIRLRLAALFHDITKPIHRRLVEKGATFYGHEVSGSRVAKSVMSRLRYSKDITDDVATLVERHMFTTAVTDKGRRRLIKRVGEELIYLLLDLRRADVEAQGMGGSTEDVDQFEQDIRDELSQRPPLGCRDLALNGEDIMKMFKLKPGPVVGVVLEHLLETVLDNPQDNTPDRLEAAARTFMEKHGKSLNTANDKESNL